jgi:2'-5' RNA ligase
MPTEIDRLFFALWPPDEVRTELSAASRQLRQKWHPAGRWIGAHRYHLTLHFLGDYPVFPEAIAGKAMEAARHLRSPRFELRLDQAGSFNNRDIPWWLGPSQVPEALKQLWRDLRDVLKARGVPYDSRLRLSPHVTVLRDASQTLAPTPVSAVDWPVASFALIHSHLGARSAYRVLETWPLSAESARSVPAAQRDLWET